jgi:hypothetical protein
MRLKLGLTALACIPSALADWTSFRDPLEKAFTLDVPQGWTVKGGMFRLGYSDYRPIVDLKSPDGKVSIRLGDVTIPSYFIPNAYHPREGEIYDLGAQALMTVAKFRSGQEYAALYARSRFKGACQTLSPRRVEGPPPVADIPEEEALVKKSSIGQAAYECDGVRRAYVYARTALYEGFWQVHGLASFVAPASQVAAARSIIERCAKSFKLADQWIQYQKKMDQDALVYQRARQQARRRQLSQQVAQFEMKMQTMKNQVNAFENRQTAQSAQVENWGNILTGITPTTDPLGNPRNVWTGPKSGYWTDGKGQVINSDSAPGPGWQPLKPRP